MGLVDELATEGFELCAQGVLELAEPLLRETLEIRRPFGDRLPHVFADGSSVLLDPLDLRSRSFLELLERVGGNFHDGIGLVRADRVELPGATRHRVVERSSVLSRDLLELVRPCRDGLLERPQVLERGAVHLRDALLRLAPEFPPLLIERALEPLGPLRQRVLQDVVERPTTLRLLLLLGLSHLGSPAGDQRSNSLAPERRPPHVDRRFLSRGLCSGARPACESWVIEGRDGTADP